MLLLSQPLHKRIRLFSSDFYSANQSIDQICRKGPDLWNALPYHLHPISDLDRPVHLVLPCNSWFARELCSLDRGGQIWWWSASWITMKLSIGDMSEIKIARCRLGFLKKLKRWANVWQCFSASHISSATKSRTFHSWEIVSIITHSAQFSRKIDKPKFIKTKLIAHADVSDVILLNLNGTNEL